MPYTGYNDDAQINTKCRGYRILRDNGADLVAKDWGWTWAENSGVLKKVADFNDRCNHV
jgi:hypothetical protein